LCIQRSNETGESPGNDGRGGGRKTNRRDASGKFLVIRSITKKAKTGHRRWHGACWPPSRW